MFAFPYRRKQNPRSSPLASPAFPPPVYRALSKELIFLCRFFAQAHELSIVSTFRLRNVLIAADDALESAINAGYRRTSEAVDNKFRMAIDLLGDFAKDFPLKDSTSDPNISGTVTGEVKMNVESKSPLMILHALKTNLHSNPMGDNWRGAVWRDVDFYLLDSPHDRYPILVRLMLSDSPNIQEILRDFSFFMGKKGHLTLKDNPHFYANLPRLLKAHGDSVKIDPTEDFRHGDKFYVLTDKHKPVHILTGNKVLYSFGNLWRSENTIILKDVCGRLMGGSIVEAYLKGTFSGFYSSTRLPISTGGVPRAFRTRNDRGLHPIGTELYPWTGWERFIDRPPMDSSVAFCLHFFPKRAAPLLIPLAPTSEQPGYPVAYKTHIHGLDDDSLLQIFGYYRLKHEENWNLRLTWRHLVQVCRRWRHFIFDLSSHLDICLSLTKHSPLMDMLGHLPPIPLVIDYLDSTRTMTSTDQDNIRLGLERHDRIRRVGLQAPSSSFHPWLLQMNQHFPRLEDLSLLFTTTETEETSLMFPETLQAPNLRHLSLHGICLPAGLSLLSSAIALSTLSLTHIRASCYFPPRHLATQLINLPHLEELSIGFAILILLPSNEGELLPAPIPPVTMPALRRVTFQGVDAYLDNLAAQINAPLLERLTLTLPFDLTFTLANLSEFIHRTEGFRWLFARVIFNKDGVSIDAGHNGQQGGGKSCFHVNVNCEPVDWQIDSATQICSALGRVLSSVEDLTVDLHDFGMPSDWENTLEDVPWHELLLPFIGVKKLHIGSSLTLELSQALNSGGGGLILPELEELEVSLKIDEVTNALTAFIETRESVGRHIDLLVPPEDEEENIRIRTTLAARRSQRQELENHWQRKVDTERKELEHRWQRKVDAERRKVEVEQRKVEVEQRKVEAERKEKEIWKARALALEERLKELDVS